MSLNTNLTLTRRVRLKMYAYVSGGRGSLNKCPGNFSLGATYDESKKRSSFAVLEFYGGWALSRNRVVIPARQDTLVCLFTYRVIMVGSAHSQVALDPCADQQKDCSAQGHPGHKKIFLYRTWSSCFVTLAWHSSWLCFVYIQTGASGGSVRAGGNGPSITVQNHTYWVTLLLSYSQPAAQPARRAAVLGQPSSLRTHRQWRILLSSWEKALALRILVYLRTSFLYGLILLSLLYKLRKERGGLLCKNCPALLA